tara:strand:- start:53 stop:1498 length:1446 start_codon:yes stop_codon:yes gene_type:complete
MSTYNDNLNATTTGVVDYMGFNTNKVNRNFVLKNHIYFNQESWNRSGDATPRYFVKPVKLLGVERVGFTNNSRKNSYGKYGNRFWAYKNDDISNSDAEKYYSEIQNRYPYGFVGTDKYSVLRYEHDVKYNESYQSFYKTYWEDNAADIQQPKKVDGQLDYPYPYIEFTCNEIVTVKHNVGTVPATGSDISHLYATYDDNFTYYESSDISCEDEEMYVIIGNLFYFDDEVFYINGLGKNALTLGSGQSYYFHLSSGNLDTWPTGVGGAYSGVKFAFSTGVEGSWGGFSDYTSGVERFEAPTTTNYYLNYKLKNGDPSDGHPYYYSGDASGYVISGGSFGSSEKNSADITVKRGHTYVFNQTGSSNDGHPVYISTGPSGNAYEPEVYTTNTRITGESSDGSWNQGSFYFRVPWSAPDTLYYQSLSGKYTGGKLNVTDPSSSAGNLPGHVIKFTPPEGEGKNLYYYTPDISGAGGWVHLKTSCT